MRIVTLILDVLIYLCGAAVIGVGGYVILRFIKGEARKHKRKN